MTIGYNAPPAGPETRRGLEEKKGENAMDKQQIEKAVAIVFEEWVSNETAHQITQIFAAHGIECTAHCDNLTLLESGSDYVVSYSADVTLRYCEDEAEVGSITKLTVIGEVDGDGVGFWSVKRARDGAVLYDGFDDYIGKMPLN
jgi:hypothetical protein